MPLKMSKLSLLRLTEGDKAAADEILRAIVNNEGSKLRAAEELEIKKTTLYRLIDELKLWKRIDSACKKFRARAGRRRGPVSESVLENIREGRRDSMRETG